MRGFFLGDNPVEGDLATVSGELYRHMARVLRLKAGAEVQLTGPAGAQFDGVIEEVGAKTLTVRLKVRESAPEPEAGLQVTLYQGLPKGEKFDLILQKCTELGASEIVAFAAARSVVKLSAERGAGRQERCERIVAEAARQCGWRLPPRVQLGGELAQVLRESAHQVKLLLWEDETTTRLSQVFAAHPQAQSVAVVVGPEGGLTPEEVAAARSQGFVPVSLGRRILRTETAGLAIMAILQFHWGDLG
ncbi:ribosomal RNA small subunit methyltransferase E [Geomonas silvestris]|uniref:Ribosomal RNA small subunit methyltransferase E n=1 Tax=Geomonas silvestris TaxID=2740184 RepID=A0A6V8MET6_9BACT|nr:16S rRNA (uracil(1498)-N(3))-methyltransferase [Geomonas silvestris]GFO58497.1 ribosomal RNA small subunit methyltransferase E [Geomonas silvestris]